MLNWKQILQKAKIAWTVPTSVFTKWNVKKVPLSLFIFLFQVPEIISTLRHAGKSSARSSDISGDSTKTSTSSESSDSSETCLSVSSSSSTSAPTSAVSPSTFAKKFEVLFCGRVSVAHKKAPPALIDECIEKFSLLHSSGTTDKGGGGLVDGLKRAFTFPSAGLVNGSVWNGTAGNATTGSTSAQLKRDSSFPSLHLDENGLCPEISNNNTKDPITSSTSVQPTSLQENRTMLFTVIWFHYWAEFSIAFLEIVAHLDWVGSVFFSPLCENRKHVMKFVSISCCSW